MKAQKVGSIRETGNSFIDHNLDYIRQYYATMSKHLADNTIQNILFLGETNPCFFKFYEQLRDIGKEYEFAWMRYKKEYTETYTHGFIIKVPQNISRVNYHLLTEETELSIREVEKVENNSYYKWAYDNIMLAHPYDNPDHVRKMLLLSEQYFLNVYDLMKPSAIIVWNPYVAFNHVAEYVARERGIRVIYAESGVIPGTIAFSTWGDLGESRPCIEYGKFLQLPISAKEVAYAEYIVAYLRRSGFNRNIQPQVKNNVLLSRKKPIIFLAGQNDLECGLQPYDDNVTQYSPVFDSSEAALTYIAELALKNDWNIVYKPHPIVARRELEKGTIPQNVIYLKQGDINDIIDNCDVCITILSTTAYVSLTREKPVVMLGKIQLNGQGCTYEAFTKMEIEKVIKDALKYGYTKEQKRAFAEHVARMCKYYLFDSLQPREIHYGQSVEDALTFIDRAIQGEAVF